MTERQRDNLCLQWTRSAMVQIKSAAWFPLRTGRLRDRAVYQTPVQKMIGASISTITFDSAVAPYIPYLQEGTSPHDIPHAFGRPLPFGIGGRFGGKFHPGSHKHDGFISNKATYLAFQVVLNKAEKLGYTEDEQGYGRYDI